MQAFNNNPSVKETYIAHVKKAILENLIDQKPTHKSEYSQEAKSLGVPLQFIQVTRVLFERLPLKEAKVFALELLEAIPVGANLEGVFGGVSERICPPMKMHSKYDYRPDAAQVLARLRTISNLR